MIVEVALIGAAELDQMIAFDPGKVVLVQLVDAVPEALADVLGIDIIGNQRVRGLPADLERPAQSGKLRRSIGRAPLPEVAGGIEDETVGQRRLDGSG